MPDLRLVVEVCHARNLLPKDGDGTSSPFVTVEFDGQKQKTKTKSNDLNPSWNEKLEFKIRSKDSLQEEEIRVEVSTAKNGKMRHLGAAVTIPFREVKKQGTEAAGMIVPYSLEKRNWLKSTGRGEIYLKCYYYEVEPPKKEEEKKKEGDEKKAEEKKKDGGGGGEQKGGKEEAKKAESKPPAVSTVYVTQDVGSFDVKTTKPKLQMQKVVHDLVVPIEYLFVKVVKGKDLAAKDANWSSDPYVEVKVGSFKATTDVKKQTLNPDWNGAVFAFASRMTAAQKVEITVWDKDTVTKDDFMGYVEFDVLEIPTRRPPDSPLAPQWYKLEPRNKDDKRVKGEIMLAVWYGTQGDEAFPDAWQSDTGGMSLNRSKVYISPRLWYLRLTLVSAQDLPDGAAASSAEIYATADLGGPRQQLHRRNITHRSPISVSFVGGSGGGGEILFVASEPFVDKLTIKIWKKVSKDKDEMICSAALPLYNVPKRFDRKPVEPRWYELEKPGGGGGDDKKKVTSRIQIAISLDGGYHVLDETTYHTSDVQPTDRRLWKPAMGILELGILSARGLLPTKLKDGKGTADTYCIAKYGKKWIRTRTVVGSLAPQWHEQYTWEVYDPCTVLTVGVFDNHLVASDADKKEDAKKPTADSVVGKLRIRLSTLRTDKTYTHLYPLISLERSGLKKRGELEIAVRFSCTSRFYLIRAYSQPLLPKLHYTEPLSLRQVQALRKIATDIQIHHLQRAEPPIRPEVVRYMLDADANAWSYRRTKATWCRLAAIFAGPAKLVRWLHGICHWQNRVTTCLVIMLYMILVCFPEQILPTLFLYMCLIGAWHWRYQPSHPPHMDVKLSMAAHTLEEELDEEFDPYPSTKSPEVIRLRYDRLRRLAGRVQSVLTDFVAQLERLMALLSWRDPRATAMFVIFCMIIAVVLYVVPMRIIGVLFGLYFFRPPRFRRQLPSAPMNFFRRLPALSDSII